ncbi:unnamed protein product, partial [Tetraodon nigroviridis]
GVEWGLLFPSANGEYQSPINLNSREARYDPALLDVGLAPNYLVCRDCEVLNDGHTVRILLRSKSVVAGGPLPSGHEYELHEVRFHWGKENQRGSEHTVNFKAFPMESKPVCSRGRTSGSTTAVAPPDPLEHHPLQHLRRRSGAEERGAHHRPLCSDREGASGSEGHHRSPAGPAVQGQSAGPEDLPPKMGAMLAAEMKTTGCLCFHQGKSKIIPCFNPNTLLPDPLLRDYWVYEGSLTTPPCSEKVTWILFRYPLTISQVQVRAHSEPLTLTLPSITSDTHHSSVLQIEEFRRLRSHIKGAELLEGNDGLLGDNFRPTQPLSDRMVRAAFQ